ncbi:MAG: hypothetical protein Q9214_007840, partial [Letrouitia sp. 1 TL-2023]
RLAADGRGLQDVTINDRFAQFAEALFTADRHAREEVKQRATMQQRLAEREKQEKEEQLRMLAQKARDDRAGAGKTQSRGGGDDSRRSRSSSSYDRSDSDSDEAAREREQMRRERQRENQKQLRQSRMGHERRMQVIAREQNRDVSEKVALGLAKPTQSSESMWDSRLFNQSSGFNSGFNEDQPYDKPLFAAQDALSSIYRPRPNVDDDDDDADGGAEYDRIKKSNRFDVLGKAKEGFKGAADAEARSTFLVMMSDANQFPQARDGPVQFEKDDADPFQIDELIKEATQGGGSKRYGVQDDEPRAAKRARVEDES